MAGCANVSPETVRGRRLRCLLFVALCLLLARASAAEDDWLRPDPELKAYLSQRIGESVDISDPYAVEVWALAHMGRLERFLPSQAARRELLFDVFRYATARALDPELVLALIQIESHFDRFAISSAGAQGLMQVMPFWKGELGRPADNLTDSTTNLEYGTTILAHYLERSDGNLVRALQRYHGNRSSLVYAGKVLGAWRWRWQTRSDAEVMPVLRQCQAVSLLPCLVRGD